MGTGALAGVRYGDERTTLLGVISNIDDGPALNATTLPPRRDIL